jgi:hypothetical protein
MSKETIPTEIQAMVPLGSGEPYDPAVLDRLTFLTGELIKAYEDAGLLNEHPFNTVKNRTIHLNKNEVRQQLQGRTILVTGGEGYVGSQLIAAAAKYSPRKIISVDISDRRVDSHTERQFYRRNIANSEDMATIFKLEKPEVVFHLAAEREPARAEAQIKESVLSNILGTENILRQCEEYGVEHCIYSSSGKAARYHTPDVYAGSKKLTEWQLAQVAATGEADYGIVRFTHILENSIVYREMIEKIDRGIVSFHSPDRYMYVQTKNEAVNLLLNSLTTSSSPESKILTVQDLGWPIQVLTIPLYEMKRRGVVVPLYFRGVPNGYESEFFRGQLNYSNQTELNLMINAQEAQFQEVDASGDLSITRVAPFSFDVLQHALDELKDATLTSLNDGVEIKTRLSDAIRDISRTSFERTSVNRAWDILRWGLDARVQNIDDVIVEHHETIRLIAQAVVPRLTSEILAEADVKHPTSTEVLQVLKRVDGLNTEVATLAQIIDN